MKHRYFSYFFWTVICWAICFLFFIFRFEVNIFSARHLSLILSNVNRLPTSFVLSSLGFVILWIGGGVSMRYFFKVADRKEENAPYHSPSYVHDHSERPVSLSQTTYVPQKGHYDGKKKAKVVNLAVPAPQVNTEKATPKLSDVLLNDSADTPKPQKAPQPKKTEPASPTIDISALKSAFDKKNIRWLPVPKIGDLKIDYFGLSDDNIYLFSVFKEATSGMVISDGGKDDQWMNAQKERVSSPLSLMAGVRKNFFDMCKKAFKGNVPFKVKTGVLFAGDLNERLLSMQDKYSGVGLYSVDGKQLPAVDSVLDSEADSPSDEFIEFASSVAHYFDSSYQIIKADMPDVDSEG